MNRRLSRAISIADYILEDDGHSTEEAGAEFNLHSHSISREIRYLGNYAFSQDEAQLKKTYVKVIQKLKSVNQQKHQISKNTASV